MQDIDLADGQYPLRTAVGKSNRHKAFVLTDAWLEENFLIIEQWGTLIHEGGGDYSNLLASLDFLPLLRRISERHRQINEHFIDQSSTLSDDDYLNGAMWDEEQITADDIEDHEFLRKIGRSGDFLKEVQEEFGEFNPGYKEVSKAASEVEMTRSMAFRCVDLAAAYKVLVEESIDSKAAARATEASTWPNQQVKPKQSVIVPPTTTQPVPATNPNAFGWLDPTATRARAFNDEEYVNRFFKQDEEVVEQVTIMAEQLSDGNEQAGQCSHPDAVRALHDIGGAIDMLSDRIARLKSPEGSAARSFNDFMEAFRLFCNGHALGGVSVFSNRA